MSLILNIDTATATAEVSFAKDGEVLHCLQNDSQKDHAAFLQTAIQQLLKNANFTPAHIDAVALTAGPGSYTGLRVGMASAKGLCYALNKPLIALNTLQVLAVGVQQVLYNPANILFCPMIDARRMEVFTALYDEKLNPLLAPCAMVLQQDSFLHQLQRFKIVFFGSGAAKWQLACAHPNASFATVSNIANAMAFLGNQHFVEKKFADLAYSEPFYLKAFQDKI